MNRGGRSRPRPVWPHDGRRRPAFALTPGPGQESVWDYPRPPAICPESRPVEVRCGEVLIARSRQAIRVLETASPPTFYLPRSAVRFELLRTADGHSVCEWKGTASYYDLVLPDRTVPKIAWSYDRPHAEFAPIAGFLSFYPGRVECRVGGQRVRAQAGGFYGGWVTDEIVGPFKGEPGTAGW